MKLYELIYIKNGVHYTAHEHGVTYMQARGVVIREVGYVKFESVTVVDEVEVTA